MSAEVVKRALDDGDTERALNAALVAWRGSRAPVIADVIDAIGDKDPAPAPKGRTKEDFQLSWLALARDDQRSARETGALARSLRKKMPIAADYYGVLRPDYAREKYGALLARLARLEDCPADPRVARALAQLVHDAPYSAFNDAAADTIYGAMLRALVAMGDVRQADVLAALVRSPRAPRATVRDYFARALPAAITALRGVAVQTPADAEAWAEIVSGGPSQVSADGRSSEELLRAIYADPDDDDARRVYADLLQEAGDARGELISLQLQQARGAASAKQNKRVRALLRDNRARWLGDDLERVLVKVGFERGFLHSAELAQNAVATDEVWTRAANDERLGTLRELRKGRGSGRRFAAFVSGGARALRVVEVPSSTVLDTILGLDGPRPIEELALPRPPARKMLAAMVEAPALENLRRLRLTLDIAHLSRVIDQLIASELLERLEALTIISGSYRLDGAPELMRRWPEMPTSLRVLAFGRGFNLQAIVRDEHGVTARCVGWAVTSAPALVEALPEETRELTLSASSQGGPDPDRVALDAAVRARGENSALQLRYEGYDETA